MAKNKNKKNIITSLKEPVSYSGGQYGFDNLYGKGIKICIIDTGLPTHKDIPHISDAVNFVESSKDNKDKDGHSTMVSGIIGSNNRSGVVGVAPASEILYAKVINQTGSCEYNALLAAVLWAIVKKVDIILISLGSSSDYPILKDAIQKAHENGICVFAAAGNQVDQIDYPAQYPEVISVSSSKLDLKVYKHLFVDKLLSEESYITTYLNNKYISVTGSSLSAALVAGVAALILESNNGIELKSRPEAVYMILSQVFSV